MALYEIAEVYRRFIEADENGEIPDDAFADTLASICLEFDEEVDNIACAIKNDTADIEAIKAEESALAARRKVKEARIARLKEYLSRTVLDAGRSKIETPRNKISFRKSEGVTVGDEQAFIEWAMKERADLIKYGKPSINRTAIKEALASGDVIPGACVETKMNLQLK